jgi:hypothetical protein
LGGAAFCPSSQLVAGIWPSRSLIVEYASRLSGFDQGNTPLDDHLLAAIAAERHCRGALPDGNAQALVGVVKLLLPNGAGSCLGLFDFVKTIGNTIFGEGESDPAAKIKAEIEKNKRSRIWT